MSLATGNLATSSAYRATRGDALALRIRGWLRQRREAVVLHQVEPRLREDAGLPMDAAPPRRAATRLRPVGGG